jgi:hypothetical protein
MEGPPMSLSGREQHKLDLIRDRLTGSDPGLAALLATFTRLASGEDMPSQETILAAAPRRAPATVGQPGPGWQWTAALLWLLLTTLMITAAVVMSRG